MSERLVLGIDGGGTKTAVIAARVLGSAQFEVLGRGQSGTSNVMAAGFETATANLQEAIAAAWDLAAQPARPADCAVLALAGAGTLDVQDRLSAWARQSGIAERVEFIHDAAAVYAAGIAGDHGVALVAGTGSVAYGRNLAGATVVAGGWGAWFGDEGSAFAIGQAGLRAVSKAADGRGPATQLTAVFLDHLELSDPRQILGALGGASGKRYAIAQLASYVTQLAEQGDEVALSLVVRAGSDLASLVATTASQLSLGRSFPWALAGGVLTGSAIVRTELHLALNRLSIHPARVELISEPALGCVKQACRAVALSD